MRRWSLRTRLLVGILAPVLAVVAFNTVSLYRQALHAADTAYDRTLLASAKAIGELLELSEGPGTPHVVASLPYSALEAFEADNRSRIYFKVTGFTGEMVAGFEDLPTWKGTLPVHGPYAALVDFYDDHYRDQAVRVAVLLEPVTGPGGQGMATVQVAETLELRRALAQQLLVATLWRQAALLAVIALVVVVVVQRATAPVRELSARLRQRAEDDLSPLDAAAAPPELHPVVEAINAVMARLGGLLEHQKRFVRDASHQLRTPLAVLKAQVQSAARGDVPPAQALAEMGHTVEGGDRPRPGSGAGPRMEAARADAHPAAQRDPPCAAGQPAGGAARDRHPHRGVDHRRPGPRHRQHAARTPVPALRRGQPRRWQRAGPGDLPRNRAVPGRRDLARQSRARRARRRPGRRRPPAPGFPPMNDEHRVRLDKWLWAARFFKTRALAAEEADKGRVQVNGANAKPARELHPGDRIRLRQGVVVREVDVLALSSVRGPAPVAQALYRETPESVAERERAATARRLAPEPAASLEDGRPTKRDRRRIADWQRWSASVDDLEDDPPPGS